MRPRRSHRERVVRGALYVALAPGMFVAGRVLPLVVRDAFPYPYGDD
ncbi:hypothetical protein SEA_REDWATTLEHOG_133 [Gordonia phage RedWattleHog]|uniref:Uncharacterized protein n=1 Tax=Gordonia phage Stormageddon TaxID=2656541 RepID=A0A649VRW3_9CAUD|nr:hypothetical protein KHQ86_gp169 [Gordonia phage Stormageddon]QGJ94991.1 hypothetical protein SEA_STORMAGEDDON_131 [Gordonia phage Stormageddon]QLF83636.1 hypothetical protein SEA_REDWATTLEHOG_133 [Gordonia phage RedWattleHog]